MEPHCRLYCVATKTTHPCIEEVKISLCMAIVLTVCIGMVSVLYEWLTTGAARKNRMPLPRIQALCEEKEPGIYCLGALN